MRLTGPRGPVNGARPLPCGPRGPQYPDPLPCEPVEAHRPLYPKVNVTVRRRRLRPGKPGRNRHLVRTSFALWASQALLGLTRPYRPLVLRTWKMPPRGGIGPRGPIPVPRPESWELGPRGPCQAHSPEKNPALRGFARRRANPSSSK